MDEIKYSFDRKFEGNILTVRRTRCGKTTFVQNLGKNKLFRDITTVYWISKITLSEEREEKIRQSFGDQEVNFNYPENLDDFNHLIQIFMQRKSNYVNSELGEEMVLDKLIVMDGVSGLADKSDDFANFLTVSQKYGMTCVYIFHTIYPSRQNWEMIMSQTQIFNFFPGSVHSSSINRTLFLFANRYKNTYLPIRNIWLNRLYFDISNPRQKQCLTVDTRDVNDLGPGKFRTQADNGMRQICYFNRNKTDTRFNSFVAAREQTYQKDVIRFSIDKVITNINNSNVTCSDLSDELKSINNDNIQSKLQQHSESDITRGETATNKNRDGDQTKRRRKYTGHGPVSKKPRFLSR